MEKTIENLLPLIKKAINENSTIRIYPRGKSMMPMIKEGVDSVVLSKADDLKKYDIVFFKSDDSFYSLHRITKITKDKIYVCGDNQSKKEKIDREQIIAKVESWYKGEEKISNDDKHYRKYIRKIMIIRPFRRVKRKVFGWLLFFYMLELNY